MPPSLLFIQLGYSLERLTAEANTISLAAREMALLFLLVLLAKGSARLAEGSARLAKGSARLAKGSARLAKGSARLAKGSARR
jgi:X-X-X-Leu-X-X-Gly heptad repeat protein